MVGVVVNVRKNASRKRIHEAMERIKKEWEEEYKNAPIIDWVDGQPVKRHTPTYYLSIGGVIRWGYRNGLWAWGFNKSGVDYSLACQIK